MDVTRGLLDGRKKGVLLTLLVVVLFILMLGEILTYVLINSNYDSLVASGSAASGQGSIRIVAAAGAQNFLHQGLSAALGVLLAYESNVTWQSAAPINSTQYFLQSLMTNGTYGGINFSRYMGSAVLASYDSALVAQAGRRSVNLTISNASVQVFQGGSFSANATYSALFTAVSASGKSVYPVHVSTGVSLNSTQDPLGILDGSPAQIQGHTQYAKPVLIGGITAAGGSTSPFSFAYGTIVVPGGKPNCGTLQGNEENQNFILAADVSQLGSVAACGFGGVVTTTQNPNIDVPYLYYSNPNIFGLLQNGTQVLLNGRTLSLLNMTGLQTAIQNGYYYPSPYTPSYFGYAARSFVAGGGNGMFSFNPLRQEAASFNGGACSPNCLALTNSLTLNGPFTVSLWFETPQANTVAFSENLIDTDLGGSYGFSLSLCGSGGCMGSLSGLQLSIGDGAKWAYQSANAVVAFTPNSWHSVIVEVNGTSAYLFYDGGPYATVPYKPDVPILSGQPGGAHTIQIGASNGANQFLGEIANIQVYNAKLTPEQAQALYYEGIGAPPINYADLMAWWPLNGNPGDYSGSHNGLVAAIGSVASGNILYAPVTGYFGDPVYSNVQSLPINRSVVEGVMNCANPTQCTNLTLQHLYLGNARLSYQNGAPVNETDTFGLQNDVLPSALSLSSPYNGMVKQQQKIPWMGTATQAFTMSIWVYPTSSGGIVIDENNGILHNSWLELVGGIGEAAIWGGAGQKSLGAIPTNKWTNIVLEYSGSGSQDFNGFVNGVGVFMATSYGRTAPFGGAYYALGEADTQNLGSGAPFNGMLFDFQVYNSFLSGAQVQSLYLNDNVPSTPANMAWGLSTPYGGMFNTTAQSNGGDYGIFYTGGPGGAQIMCSSSNEIRGGCPGVQYVPA